MVSMKPARNAPEQSQRKELQPIIHLCERHPSPCSLSCSVELMAQPDHSVITRMIAIHGRICRAGPAKDSIHHLGFFRPPNKNHKGMPSAAPVMPKLKLPKS